MAKRITFIFPFHIQQRIYWGGGGFQWGEGKQEKGGEAQPTELVCGNRQRAAVACSASGQDGWGRPGADPALGHARRSAWLQRT